MRFLCLIDCLAQKNGAEVDQFGNRTSIINLRAKSGETYDSVYDLCEIANAPGEMPLFEMLDAPPERNMRSRGSYVSQPVTKPSAPPKPVAQTKTVPKGRVSGV